MTKPTFSCSTERTRVLGLLGVLVVTSVVTGCNGDQCVDGEIRCVGNMAEACGWVDSDDRTLIWHGWDCGEGYCRPLKDPNGDFPICALAPDPDPRCAGADYLGFCDGNVVNVCLRGYVTATTDCTTGSHTGDSLYSSMPSTGYCVSSETWAACAMDAAPNPLCSGKYFGQTVCDGNRVLECGFGYVIDAGDCPPTRTCVPGEYAAFCAMSATPVPGCPLDAAGYITCKDGAIVTCYYGYAYSQEVCPAGHTCSIDSYGTVSCYQ